MLMDISPEFISTFRIAVDRPQGSGLWDRSAAMPAGPAALLLPLPVEDRI
jgi:hypothetical protein